VVPQISEEERQRRTLMFVGVAFVGGLAVLGRDWWRTVAEQPASRRKNAWEE
jgi:hypothetical protein